MICRPMPEKVYLCLGGPLDGESHCQGESFTFDGRPLGLGTGTYRLRDSVYLWEPDRPSLSPTDNTG